MHRDLHFAIERAATNIALRTVSTALVIEEMYSGATRDLRGLHGIRRDLAPLRPRTPGGDRRARGHRSRHRIAPEGGPLHRPALPDGRALRPWPVPRRPVPATLRPVAGGASSPSSCRATWSLSARPTPSNRPEFGRRIAAEFGRGSGLGPLLARHMPSALRRAGGKAASKDAAPPPDVVVASSGNLAHVYFTREPGRMTSRGDPAALPGPGRDPCPAPGNRGGDRPVGGRAHRSCSARTASMTWTRRRPTGATCWPSTGPGPSRRCVASRGSGPPAT